jgi:hypothetical protein
LKIDKANTQQSYDASVLIPFVSGFSLKQCLLMERARGHESGAGGTSAEEQNREPDRACKGVKQNATKKF